MPYYKLCHKLAIERSDNTTVLPIITPSYFSQSYCQLLNYLSLTRASQFYINLFSETTEHKYLSKQLCNSYLIISFLLPFPCFAQANSESHLQGLLSQYYYMRELWYYVAYRSFFAAITITWTSQTSICSKMYPCVLLRM